MIKKIISICLLISSLSALAANNTPNVTCRALCAYHSNHIVPWDVNYDQTVEGPEGPLGKYYRLMSGSGSTIDHAFGALVTRCFDHAASASASLFLGTQYAPQLLEPGMVNAQRENVCRVN